jgi:hypothetical protein
MIMLSFLSCVILWYHTFLKIRCICEVYYTLGVLWNFRDRKPVVFFRYIHRSVMKLHFAILTREGMYYKHNTLIKLRCIFVNIVAMVKQEVSHILGVCMCVASVMQHAKRMHRFTLPTVACVTGPYLSTLWNKLHDLLKKVTEHKMCVLNLPTTFAWNNFHSKENSVIHCH